MKMTAKSRALDKVYKRRDRYEIPEWQRGEVWDTEKKQELIDSILRGWRLPKFYFVKVSEETFQVVDGQQRLAAIFEFFANELPLGSEAPEGCTRFPSGGLPKQRNCPQESHHRAIGDHVRMPARTDG